MPTVKFRIRRDTAANWASLNPVLGLGEPGLETDTRKVKYGDGATAWATLPYSAGSGATIGVGGAAPSSSGAGISFPETQSASTDPNTLDDYEEGTWTPTVTASSGTITTKTATGKYTKIGNMVHARITVNITTNGTGAGAVIVTLPFASSADGVQVGAGREGNATGDMLQIAVDPSSSTAIILNYNNTYPAANGYKLSVSLSYAT